MGKVGTYFRNAVILTITGLGLRAAGMFFRIYIAGRIGAEGMGLYQLIFTLYSLCITFATAGVSVASTRLAAEELAQRDQARTVGAMGKVIRLGLWLGLIAMVVQYILAYPAAKYWLGDVRAELSLKILAPSLPFMAVAAAVKGYFFARRQVGPSSKSQIYEQVIRIGLVMWMMPYVLEWGIQYACAVVVLGNTLSEVLSCLLLMWYYRRDVKSMKLTTPPKAPGGTVGRMWHIAAPVEGGRVLDSALHTVENILVPACLLAFCGSREVSLAQFGALKGMAMPILLFPFSFLNPLATLFLPEVTEAHILHRQKTLETIVGRIMLFTNMFSVLAGGLIAMNAYPLARLLYHDESIGLYLLVLAPVLPCMYLDAMGDAVLKGLGEEVATFRYSLWDSILRIGLIILLLPKAGIEGFLVVMLCSNVLSALLNIFRISKVAKIKTLWYKWFIQPIALFFIAAAVGLGVQHVFDVTGDWPQLIVSFLVVGGLYALLLLRCGLWDIIQGIFAANRKKAAEHD